MSSDSDHLFPLATSPPVPPSRGGGEPGTLAFWGSLLFQWCLPLCASEPEPPPRGVESRALSARFPGATNPASSVNHKSMWGNIAAGLFSAWAVGLTGFVFAAVSGPAIIPFARTLYSTLPSLLILTYPFEHAYHSGDASEHCRKARVSMAMRKTLCIVLVVGPLWLFAWGAVLGGPLAAIEGWRWRAGFLFLLGCMMQSTSVYTTVVPQNGFGKVTAIYFDRVSLSVLAIILGMIDQSAVDTLSLWVGFSGGLRPLPFCGARAKGE